MTETLRAPAFIERVETALDELRPMLRKDGGDVELLDTYGGIVTVRLQGHCAGCPLSQQTLKAGIEAHLKKRLPEIVRVEQAPSAGMSSAIENGIPTPKVSCAGFIQADDKPTATSKLHAEHRVTRAALNVLESALQRMCATEARPEQTDLDDANKVFKHLSGAFARHMEYEEDVLFKKIEQLIEWGKPTLALLKEHNELRRAIAALGAGLADNAGKEELATLGGTLIVAVRNHLYREENTVYFEADDMLDAGALD